MWYALAAVLAAISLALGEQASRTTLRLRVVDAHGDSVALLRLTLEDADGTSHTVITDAAGQAVVGPLPGTHRVCARRAARAAPGPHRSSRPRPRRGCGWA